MFSSLLSPLLFSALVFAVAARPVGSTTTELRELAASNFSSITRDGVWFVEFFSPWCSHCRQFAPTWKQLVEHVESQVDPGVKLAQVNCVTQGDLCSDKMVRSYPSLKIYEDGKEVDEFNDFREFDILTKYVAKHARKRGKSKSGFLPNSDGTVLPLDKGSFQDTIAKGPTFVKFFAPWCGHCKKLAPTWIEFASQMKNKATIAEVNCEEHSGLCSEQKVQGYPMIFFYQHGRTVDYTGRRNLEALEAFAESALAPPLKSISITELSSILMKEEVLYLLIHDDLKSELRDRVEEAAQSLHGTPRLLSVQSSPQLLSLLILPDKQELPVLVTLKDHSMTPFNKLVLIPETPIYEIANWLIWRSLPISTELNAENFQRIMGASPPSIEIPPRLVVLAAVDLRNQSNIDIVKEIGTTWSRGPDANEEKLVVFVWMDREQWARWLKNAYGVRKNVDQAVVIVDHGRLLYYDQSITGGPIKLEVSSIVSALDNISRGMLKPKHSQNIAERFARRLNVLVLGVQSMISRHPIRAISLFVVMLVGVFLGGKRFLGPDTRRATLYTNHKSGLRLD